MKITFNGAAGGEVTGSMLRLSCKNASVVVDCGKRLEKSKLLLPNRLSDNADADTVVLTHPHTDHVCDLPDFVDAGFAGEIISTPPAKDITQALLLQNYPRYKVNAVMQRYNQTIPYDERVEIADGVFATFIPAAHILGSSLVLIETDGLRILFSGDVGNKNKKLFDFPELIPEADIFVSESTYGKRDSHPNFLLSLDDLYESINRTISRRGKFRIPVFSIHRTQELLYYLNKGKYEGSLPDDLKIVLDAPLGEAVTKIYLAYRNYFSREINEAFQTLENPFSYSKVHNYNGEPCVILASSSLPCSEGKIVGHFLDGLENPEDTFAFTAHIPEGSLAERLVNGCETVHLDDEILNVKAEIYNPVGFSSHADAGQLLDLIKMVKPKIVFLNHGEDVSRLALKEKINGSVGKVILPAMGEEFDLDKFLKRRVA